MTVDINNLNEQERQDLLQQLKADQERKNNDQRTAYEGLRRDFMTQIKELTLIQQGAVEHFYNYLVGELDAFRSIMAEYGRIAKKQRSFTLIEGDFKLEVKSNKVKKFDERADIAASRLIPFLKNWVKDREKGTDDPMYQLAMLSIERNKKGDLDYKQVSNLYKLESKFASTEYSAIMELLRESHVVDATATHFYFYKKDEMGVWKKIEISFNRL